jgi:ATP-dependent Zn protease
VSWLVEHASPLVKVTIVPRGRSLGAAWYLPDERHLTTTEQMLDEICAAWAGGPPRIMFGKVSTGALSDLEKVTKQAYAMVTMYGLNDRIGNISFYDSTGQNEYGFGKPYSDHTAQTIDEEVSTIVEGQYERAKKHPLGEQGQTDRPGHPTAGEGGDLQGRPGEDLRQSPFPA